MEIKWNELENEWWFDLGISYQITPYHPKHKKVIPSSRSGSQSNRKKSKTKKSQKNVTFKRRRARK